MHNNKFINVLIVCDKKFHDYIFIFKFTHVYITSEFGTKSYNVRNIKIYENQYESDIKYNRESEFNLKFYFKTR